MSAEVENKIVSMEFQNEEFERKVKESIDTIRKLKNTLDDADGASGLDGIQKSVDSIKDSLSDTTKEMGAFKNEFVKKSDFLNTFVDRLYRNVSNKIISMGANIAKSLFIDPIKDGLDEYEQKIKSINTIYNMTGGEGVANMSAISEGLNELNHYADLTIYRFADMRQAVEKFTIAGNDFDTSVGMTQGIGNLAAYVGASADQFQSASYMLSQAMNQGRVMAYQWRSLQISTLGSKPLEDTVKLVAKMKGVDVDKIIAKKGSLENLLVKVGLLRTYLRNLLACFPSLVNTAISWTLRNGTLLCVMS